MLGLIAVVIYSQVVDVSSHRLSSTSNNVKNHPSFISTFKQSVAGAIVDWGGGGKRVGILTPAVTKSSFDSNISAVKKS